MIRKKMYALCLSACALGLSACERGTPVQGTVWVPIYMPASEAAQIQSKPPKAVITGGKIYAWQDYAFQLEPNNGIHVYKMVQQEPQPYQFIQVYGAQEISIKGNMLYTNNFADIVALDISDMSQVQVRSRVRNTFSIGTQHVPPQQGFFQCVDTTKGIVVGWEKKNNIEATCKY